MRSASERPSLWRQHDFRLVWIGQALSELGSQVSTVAFPLLVLGLGGSPGQAGVVGFAKALPLVALSLPAGLLADRVDRKRLMMACDAGRAIALASIPLALALGRPPFAQLVLVALIDGALFATSYIAERGALRHIVPAERLSEAVAQNEGRTFAATILGPPLGGVLYGVARFLPFATDALSYLASTLALWRTRARFDTRDGTTQRGVIEGLRWLWARPFFRATSLLFAAGNPVFLGLYLLAVLLAKRHGASSEAVGAMFAIVGAGGLLGALLAGPLRRRVSSARPLIAEEWLIAAVVPLLLVVHEAALIGLIVAATELLTPLNNSIVSGCRVALAPDRLQGRVQAAGMLIAQSFGWLGPLAVGFGFQHAGPDATVLALAAWAAALAVAGTLTPALRDVPS
jgi:predicted MFS family arabinose efflux permease